MERFILQKSAQQPDHWVCTDTENSIVCIFEDHKYNDTQNFSLLEDFNPDNYMKLAQITREFGDWLQNNHRDKIF